MQAASATLEPPNLWTRQRARGSGVELDADVGRSIVKNDVRLRPALAQRESSAVRGEHRIETALIVALATATWFRLLHLSSVPGVSGDEGWWGVQAISWLGERPYQAHTTSGNPTDLFFLVPLAIVHAVAPPSFLLLRIVPALVNVLALPVGFWFARRLYGDTFAWMQTVALATAPTAIAHSRICQDPSQTIFWTSIVIYLSLLGFKERANARMFCAAALLIFPVALWTHPTNVFIAPFLVLPCITAAGPLLPSTRRGRAIVFAGAAIALVIAAAIAWPAFVRLERSNDFLNKPWLALAMARLMDRAQWLEYVVNYARLFSGITVYHYFSGARPWTIPYDLGCLAVGCAVIGGLWRLRGSRSAALDYGLLLAWAATWVAFFAVAGPTSLRPHAERWGLCLIVPGTLVLARGVTAWIETMPHLRRPTLAAATIVATSLLASFYVNYFREFATTGGRSHPTYITAATEPKQQALEQILARSDRRERVMIVAQEWWDYWPIAYLASRQTKVSVSQDLGAAEIQPAFQEALSSGQLFLVEFVGTPELAAAAAWVHARGLHATTTTVHAADGRDLLDVVQVAR
jgi:hypothetical protein